MKHRIGNQFKLSNTIYRLTDKRIGRLRKWRVEHKEDGAWVDTGWFVEDTIISAFTTENLLVDTMSDDRSYYEAVTGGSK